MSDIDALWALVPLKRLDHGKARLASALAPGARRALAAAMARDVIAALRRLPLPRERVVVVGNDPEVVALASECGASVFEPRPEALDPLNAELRQALEEATRRGARHALILHADLPCIDAAVLHALLAAHWPRTRLHARAVTLATDRAGSGTNALLCSPPQAIALRFGRDSRRLHLEECAKTAVEAREFERHSLAFDLDEETDLRALVRALQTSDNAAGRHTRESLQALGLMP